jgi:hypothetical protein
LPEIRPDVQIGDPARSALQPIAFEWEPLSLTVRRECR